MQKGQKKTQFLKNMQQEERKLSIQVDPQVFGLSGREKGGGGQPRPLTPLATTQ